MNSKLEVTLHLFHGYEPTAEAHRQLFISNWIALYSLVEKTIKT